MSAHEVVMKINGTTGRVVGNASSSLLIAGQHSTVHLALVHIVSTPASTSKRKRWICVPTEYGAWSGDTPEKGTNGNSFDLCKIAKDAFRYLTLIDGFLATGGQVGALLTFPPLQTVALRPFWPGWSVFDSTQQACNNAEAEIPHFDFEAVKKASRSQWNDVLKRIRVDPVGVPRDSYRLQTYFFLMGWFPSFTGLTSFQPIIPEKIPSGARPNRTTTPSIATISPGMQKRYRYATHPRGSNGDPILAEFYVKFSDKAALLNVSSSDLYQALIADAETCLWIGNFREADQTMEASQYVNDVPSRLFYNTTCQIISQVTNTMGKPILGKSQGH
ncbi:glycoside hydrolase family protein [Salix suchowensis]|nr:glycoside hydrolase family protein [Salix suchowensis]